jgi:NADPH2:quinone reductase
LTTGVTRLTLSIDVDDILSAVAGHHDTAQRFDAFRIFEDGGTVQGRVVEATLDELSPGGVVIKAAYSSVNYKDAMAATGGKIIRRFPLIGGIDVAGTVVSSDDARFASGDAVLVTGYDLGVGHDGGYAGYVRVPGEWVVPVPAGLTLLETMSLGTAGFTAGLAVQRLEQNGLASGRGPVAVTGATGGVGSVAVAVLSTLGYEVTAITGKGHERAYLQALGAAQVISRHTLETGTRPLEKATWAGAVDAVGGDMLAWLTRTMNYGASIASTGLTGGVEIKMTVIPFLLRGINLLGIDSVQCPMDVRQEVWRRLATQMKPASLGSIVQPIGLAELPRAFETLKSGNARGRFVVSF